MKCFLYRVLVVGFCFGGGSAFELWHGETTRTSTSTPSISSLPPSSTLSILSPSTSNPPSSSSLSSPSPYSNLPSTTVSSKPPSTLTPPTSTITPPPFLYHSTLLNLDPSLIDPSVILEASQIDQTFHQKWHMTTYYTCLPRAATMRCGTHERVLPGGDEIAGAVSKKRGGVAAWLGVAVMMAVGIL